MNREEILMKAKACVCGDREEDYGSPERNFQTIAELWTAYLGARDTGVGDILADDVAAMMALVKIARIAGGQIKDDNWIDLAGYAACGGEIQEMYPKINWADLRTEWPFGHSVLSNEAKVPTSPVCPECGAECESFYVDLWEDEIIGCENCVARQDAAAYMNEEADDEHR